MMKTATINDKRSASWRDGFNGARDASILEMYLKYSDTSIATQAREVKVQRTGCTGDLLKRAGFQRTRMFNFYPVRVRWNAMLMRLELAV